MQNLLIQLGEYRGRRLTVAGAGQRSSARRQSAYVIDRESCCRPYANATRGIRQFRVNHNTWTTAPDVVSIAALFVHSPIVARLRRVNTASLGIRCRQGRLPQETRDPRYVSHLNAGCVTVLHLGHAPGR